MSYLRELYLSRLDGDASIYPYSIPLFQQELSLQFSTPITFLVGENGSGKSTLLEAIALAAEANTVGSAPLRAQLPDEMTTFSDQLRLVWRYRNRHGFFLRAEDFLGFIESTDQLRKELEAEIASVKEAFLGRSEHALGRALSPILDELSELQTLYGNGLDTVSHGEGFLHLFRQRITPNGIYFLDEPETPLSPANQVQLIHHICDMVQQGCQFIIVTHSPILLAIPDATIYLLEKNVLEQKLYDQLPSIQFIRSFLANPTQFIR